MNDSNSYGWSSDTKVVSIAKYRQSSRQSAAVRINWKSEILNNLNLLHSPDYLPEDTSVLPNAIPHAKEFIELLPIQIDKPSLSVEASGGVLLEWYKKDQSGQVTIFSVILDGKGILFSLFKAGKRTNNYGQLSFCEESIEKILPEITQHFGTADGQRLKA